MFSSLWIWQLVINMYQVLIWTIKSICSVLTGSVRTDVSGCSQLKRSNAVAVNNAVFLKLNACVEVFDE
jgi:hypothetical protein